jgi:hypothetical protein
MTGILSLKLFLVPSLIYAVTLAGRRWGPMVAGWLSAFPVVSGPILLAVTLKQGPDFAATAAEGTLLAVVAILVFSLGYAWASNMFCVLGSMSSALAAYTIAAVVLQSTHRFRVASRPTDCGGIFLSASGRAHRANSRQGLGESRPA